MNSDREVTVDDLTKIDWRLATNNWFEKLGQAESLSDAREAADSLLICVSMDRLLRWGGIRNEELA